MDKRYRDYILYEDKDILVCHKPAGLAVQNARVGSMDMESLLKNYIAQKVPGKMPYLGIIHRLDQPVEGVLVFALNPKAAADLSRQMTAGKIKKTYLAVTEGTVKVKSAKLVDWLKKDGRTNSSAVVEGGTSGAKKAILSYEVLETWKNKEDAQDCGERNLIRIDLDTGRHHRFVCRWRMPNGLWLVTESIIPVRIVRNRWLSVLQNWDFSIRDKETVGVSGAACQVWHSKVIDIAKFLMCKSEKCVKSLDEFRKVCIM